MGAALLAGAAVAFYARHDLVLSHYDARAHLVVARRVLDNRTPGWVQLGAVWLPLPHLLALLPAQHDALFRTGAAGVIWSMAGFVVGAAAIARLVGEITGSRAGALVASALFALNRDLLYLQATPLTEALFLGCALAGAAATASWVAQGARRAPVGPGAWLAAACLTRYEAWALSAALGLLGGFALWRQGHLVPVAVRRTAALLAGPLAAIAAFLIFGRVSTGRWVARPDFFAPTNPAGGDPGAVAAQILGGWTMTAGAGTVGLAIVAGVVMLVTALRQPHGPSLVLIFALAAPLAVPAAAFFLAHPFRVRYLVSLAPFVAATLGASVGLVPRGRTLLAAGVMGLVLLEQPPFALDSPLLREARLDEPARRARQTVTDTLRREYDGRPILVSMRSLAHYLFDLTVAGLPLRAFVHEGNGPLWAAALGAPVDEVGWILIREDEREGRDALALRMRADPAFLRGFVRVAEGGGVALYRRETGEASGALTSHGGRRGARQTPGSRRSSGRAACRSTPPLPHPAT